YIDWLNSTWKPTMEAMKKAGLIIDYKVFQASPKSPDQPNIFLGLPEVVWVDSAHFLIKAEGACR
ncbi:MAG TPA: hypothetical protein VNZ53_51130, partial [Steroidobacteraceae bacterium]|nr:hypothetical protein [Steroidobacteraceae bacterium]